MASILDLARMNDSGDLAGGVSEIAAVTGAGAMMVTAVRTAGGRLRLISWQLNTAGPVTRLGDSGDAAGGASNIDIARGDRFVVACRTGAGNLRLISWDIDATGAFITRRGDSADQAGAASRIKIVAMTGTLFVTACRTDGGGILRLISWRLNPDGTLTRLADSANAAGQVSEIALTRLSENRVATSVRRDSGELRVIVWSVSAAGVFARLADSANAAGQASLIRATLSSTGLLVTAVRAGTAGLRLISWRINADGHPVRLGDSGNQAGNITDNSVVVAPDGVVSAVRTAAGALRLIAWSIDAAGRFTRMGDSASQAGTSSMIATVPGPGVPDAGGHSVTFATAVRAGNGTLRLITWGPAVVRLHFKVLTAPALTTATMLTSMQTVYATVGISVVLAGTENLNLPLLNDVDVGECAGATTVEQQQLFANRNNVGTNDVVVYFVRSTIPPLNGCASHPPGRPSVAVAQGATQWTMAHEIGHVLGLDHVGDPDRLMMDGGTANITNPPPNLIASEQSTMLQSPFTVPV